MAIINIIQAQSSGQIRIIQEDISDQLGGSNVVFTTDKNFIEGTLQVFLNGLSLRAGADFEEVGTGSFRFINYDDEFLKTINSTLCTLAVKYFRYITQAEDMQLVQEDLSDQLGGSNIEFTTTKLFFPRSLQVFLNGLSLRLDADFIETGSDSFKIINYTGELLNTLSSTLSTISVKYFKHFAQASLPATSIAKESITKKSSLKNIFSKKKKKIAAQKSQKNIIEEPVFEDDISDQVFGGIKSFYLSNLFKENTLKIFSNQVELIKNVDFKENGMDGVTILNYEKIVNKNLVAKYLIR